MQPVRSKASRRAAAVLLLCLLPLGTRAQTTDGPSATTTAPLADATTASLQVEPKFFQTEAGDTPTTMLTTSVVVDETSASAETVTTSTEPGIIVTTPATSIEVVTGTTQSETAVEVSPGLPVKVDDSSTVTLAQQLAEFERRNQFGEAFLLACEMVRQNPRDEMAYDAAIRTGLVLGLDSDVENFYKQAARNTTLPGKYFVQLAHFYSRLGDPSKLTILLDEYEKVRATDADFRLTLARLAAIAGDVDRTTRVVEMARTEKRMIFPLTILLSRAYGAVGNVAEARKVLLEGAELDYGPWEKRYILHEFLKLSGIEPADIVQMLRAVLVNESDYSKARGLAEVIMDRAMDQRIFYPLENRLAQRVNEGAAADVEVWMLALIAQRQGDKARALDLLTSRTVSNTPVIAEERANALIESGRGRDAVQVLEDLVAEQPTRWVLRMTLAEQLTALGDAQRAHGLLASIPARRLDEAEHRRFAELSVRAACATGDAGIVAARWTEVVRGASFSELQIMGDAVIQSVVDPELRANLDAEVAERLEDSDRWPLLLLQARLKALEGDHDTEIAVYAKYLEREWGNIAMLKFVAELATQYAALPLRLDSGSKSSEGGSISIQAVRSAGTDTAIQIFRRLIELQPMVADNYAGLMRVYQTRGEVETAKKVAVELAESNTSSAQVQAMAAVILDQNGFGPESLPFYEQALRIDLFDFNTWFRFANALAGAKQYAKADGVYKKFIEEGVYGKPFNQPQALAALLKIAQESAGVTALVAYLDGLRAKEIPGKQEFYLSSAKLLMQVGEGERAEAFLLEFQERYPDSPLLPDSHLLLGQIFYSRSEFDQAVQVFQDTAHKFVGTPAEVTAIYNIGEVYRQTGQTRRAIETWIQLSASLPSDDRALAGMYESAILAYRDLKDAPYAMRLLQDFLAAGSQDFALVRKARVALDKLSRGEPLPEEAP